MYWILVAVVFSFIHSSLKCLTHFRGRAGRYEVFFQTGLAEPADNGLGWAGKREKSFSTGRITKKERRKILRVRPNGQIYCFYYYHYYYYYYYWMRFPIFIQIVVFITHTFCDRLWMLRFRTKVVLNEEFSSFEFYFLYFYNMMIFLWNIAEISQF